MLRKPSQEGLLHQELNVVKKTDTETVPYTLGPGSIVHNLPRIY